jgi:hypothetical protein
MILNSILAESIIPGLAIVIGAGVILWALSTLENHNREKKKRDTQFVREIAEHLKNHHWKSVRLLDAISAGASIEYVDVSKNNVIIKTPDGLVEAKVNRLNLPYLLMELKTSDKTPYRHTNLYLNMDLDNQSVVIDDICYAE